MPNNLAKKRANKKIKRLKRNKKNKQHPLINSVDNANSLQFNKNLADSRFKTEMKKKHGISFQYGTSNIKMSEVILDFADETLNKIDDVEIKVGLIRIAILVWNLSFFPEDEQQTELLNSLEELNMVDQQERDGLLEMMRHLLQRKKMYYAHVNRPIVEYDIQHTNDDIYLNVASFIKPTNDSSSNINALP